ncbi:MAG: FHA domain-containing protein [Chloroflexota bacterium]|nr:FHA domain-containing protein [Chloroflexota bacterium]
MDDQSNTPTPYPTKKDGIQLINKDGNIIAIPSLPVTIGRAEQVDIQLDDDSVSAAHARIFYDDRVRAVCIEDLLSLNGVYINGKPTSSNILFDGVNITLGLEILTFRNVDFIPHNDE